ncbi:hypothetical protein C8Q76DRAFT_761018 [Earliella scabrosa]|nr:hypothetical protein C8Q76DRAFT_761018 [Earliella scabrosa]
MTTEPIPILWPGWRPMFSQCSPVLVQVVFAFSCVQNPYQTCLVIPVGHRCRWRAVFRMNTASEVAEREANKFESAAAAPVRREFDGYHEVVEGNCPASDTSAYRLMSQFTFECSIKGIQNIKEGYCSCERCMFDSNTYLLDQDSWLDFRKCPMSSLLRLRDLPS